MNVILILIGVVLGLIFILFILFLGENGNGNGSAICRNCVFAPRCNGKECNKLSVNELLNNGGDEE